MAFGLLPTGFLPKSFDDLKTELETAFQAVFGTSIDLTPEGPFGQLIGIIAELVGQGWDVAEAVNAAFDPDRAEGAALDAICAITGTFREQASYSTVEALATGDVGAVLPSGRQFSVDSTGVKFATLAAATLAAADAWIGSHHYDAGDLVTLGGKVYVCTDDGTTASSGGPTGTGTAITDGGVIWRYVGDGAAIARVPSQALETGVAVALAYTLTTIETPVSGWSNVSNLLDADEGRDVETDAALRVRREDEIRASGKAATEAIRAAILRDVENVVACLVFENTSNTTDGNGLPPKSVEVVVRGGDDEEIRQAVFDNVSAGIETYGTNSGTITDSMSIDHVIKFSRPTEHNIYVVIDLLVDADAYPSDGDVQVQTKIKEFGDTFAMGRNVVSSSTGAQAFKVPGVLDVVTCYIGTAPAPSSETTIPMSLRELAIFDTSRVSVTSTPSVP